MTHGGHDHTWEFNRRDVSSISFSGGDGDDEFHNTTPDIPSVAYGGDGNDTLTGGSSCDWLYGQDGADVLRGNGGPDSLYGGAGVDELHGGTSNDYLDGGNEGKRDRVWGDAGADTVVVHGHDSGWPFHYRSYLRELYMDVDEREGDAEVWKWH
jgi:Ca2+-binding RTX toxin-like protein